MSKNHHKILITGGAGFVGSEFVRQAANQGSRLIVLDKLTYAGDFKRIKETAHKINFYKTDICHLPSLKNIFKKEKPSHVIHFAAETHVDRSIYDIKPFIKTNILGTQNLIDCSKEISVKKFMYISTDEVYGESSTGKFHENFPLRPNNPYSATKASAELLLKTAMRTFNFPAIIVRPVNNYGPWQHPEKFIPVILFKALNNQKIPVYGQGKQIREWLYVGDCIEAINLILKKGRLGEIYNIGSDFENSNIKTAQTVIKLLKKPSSLIKFVKDRPGHDFRYSVDSQKLRKLGWKPKVNFEQGIEKTIAWHMQHRPWVKQKANTSRKLLTKVRRIFFAA